MSSDPSRRHPASLVAHALHNPELVEFMRQPVTDEMVSYLALQTERTIAIDETPVQTLPSPPQTPQKDAPAEGLPSLTTFICTLVLKSNVQVATLMSTLVYLQRLRSKLPSMAKGVHTHHCLHGPLNEWFYPYRHALHTSSSLLSCSYCLCKVLERLVS